MKLFDELNIETISTCNRSCATCLRQSYSNRAAVANYFQPQYLATEIIYSLIDQAAALNFKGSVCLQHFNEPLLDERIATFGHYAKKYNFSEVYLNTNGDLLTEQLATTLDGAFDRLHIALYIDKYGTRKEKYQSWFKQTKLTFTQGEHVITHYSPMVELQQTIISCQNQPCERECQMRCIIAHDGRMRLCCDDIVGVFDLGSIHEKLLYDLWYGAKHEMILATLSQAGGRWAFPYCQNCPRPNTPYGGAW